MSGCAYRIFTHRTMYISTRQAIRQQLLFKKILEEGKPAVDKYIGNFLCGGCSKNPIELLKSAGVDMSTPKPVDDALNVFEDYLKQFETATK